MGFAIDQSDVHHSVSVIKNNPPPQQEPIKDESRPSPGALIVSGRGKYTN